jgi:hypothetical protein
MDDQDISIYNVYEYTDILTKSYHKLNSITTEMLDLDDSQKLENFRDTLFKVYSKVSKKCSQLKEAVELFHKDLKNTSQKEKLYLQVIEFNDYIEKKENKDLIEKSNTIIQLYERKRKEFLGEVINMGNKNNIKLKSGQTNNIQYNNIENKKLIKKSADNDFCIMGDCDDDEEEEANEAEAEGVADIKPNFKKRKDNYRSKWDLLKEFKQDFPEQCKAITRELFGLKRINKHILKVDYIDGKYNHGEDFKTIRGSRAFILTFEFKHDNHSHINSDFCKRIKPWFETYLICLETNGTRIKVGGSLNNIPDLKIISSTEFLKQHGAISLDVMGYVFLCDVYKNLENLFTHSNLTSDKIQKIILESAKVESMRDIYFGNNKS